MDTLNKTNNDIYNLNKYKKLLLIYTSLEQDKRNLPNNTEEENKFLEDLQQDTKFYADMKNYCFCMLEDLKQKYESFKKLLDSITD